MKVRSTIIALAYTLPFLSLNVMGTRMDAGLVQKEASMDHLNPLNRAEHKFETEHSAIAH